MGGGRGEEGGGRGEGGASGRREYLCLSVASLGDEWLMVRVAGKRADSMHMMLTVRAAGMRADSVHVLLTVRAASRCCVAMRAAWRTSHCSWDASTSSSDTSGVTQSAVRRRATTPTACAHVARTGATTWQGRGGGRG